MRMFTVVAWLAAHGCGLPCASGIVANFVAEVGPSLDPCTANRVYSGLPQWSGPRRRRMLATLGDRWCEIPAQLGFVFTELREMGLLDRLLRATDPGEAAELFMLRYERPKNRNPHRRRARAWAVYRELQGMEAR